MNRFFLVFFFSITFAIIAISQTNNNYFQDYALRLDFLHGGDSNNEFISIKSLKKQPYYPGSYHTLIDTVQYGSYCINISDSATKKTIYSKCYATLYEEYKATEEAKTNYQMFEETQIIPFPKKTILIEIYNKDDNKTIFSKHINPNSNLISKSTVKTYETHSFINNGNYKDKIDIIIIPEGYTKKEWDKFIKDADKLVSGLFTYTPFLENKEAFNVKAVKIFSDESGTDIPTQNIWKNTLLESSFYTFQSERYLMTMSMHTIQDIVAGIPYDQVYVIVNTDKYGGGGIYNYYSICSANHPKSIEVFVHEFGHGFGGLGDEYGADVTYPNMHKLTKEPRDPNLTTLVNFEKKWQFLVDKNTPIPTPDNAEYKNSIGAFEGAGYRNKGIYRPYSSCIMRTLSTKEFCPVCAYYLKQMIDFYIK